MTLQWPHITFTGIGDFAAHPVIIAIEILLFAYFLVVNVIDFTLIITSLRALRTYVKLNRSGALADAVKNFATPVTVLLPVFNERENVVQVIRSLLNMHYPQFEIVVVNDGSTDDTLAVIQREFGLVPVPEARYVGLPTKTVRGVYASKTIAHLRVLDKENGGKGDALNAGLNEARYPMILATDGDSIYQPDTLEQMTQPFVADRRTVGTGAALRVLNDAEMVDGVPVEKRLPRKMIVRMQVVEYLRAALNSRFAWAPINGIMSLSGACALWKKDVLVNVGGYAANTVWEDAEMTVRVHHYMRATRTPYRIAFIPEAVCWTRVPETLGELQGQRISWQRHITETITKHRNMLFRPKSGVVGWFALPAYVLSEWLAPLWLLLGLVFVIVTWSMGLLSWQAQVALLAVVFGFTLLKMAMALMLDEVSYRTYSVREIWGLFVAAILEQFGYRQLLAVWSLAGMFAFYFKLPIRGERKGVISPLEPPYRPVAPRRQTA